MSDPRAAAAEVRVRDRPDIFVAERCELSAGWVHVKGRWRQKIGPNYADERFRPRASYTWPRRRVDEIRWVGDA